MDRAKHRKYKYRDAAELDVTPFMNLMIVLVPVLLLSMVFTHTTVIDLNFPGDAASAGAPDPDAVHLEVVVTEDGLRVADGRGGTIRMLPRADTGHDYEGLTLVMRELKRRMPDKRDITVLLQEETSYQTLVSVLDRVRSYPTVQHLEVVQAELFPEVTLGDSPSSEPAVLSRTGEAAETGGRS
jgi:biopolymer transport protein ExbD